MRLKTIYADSVEIECESVNAVMHRGIRICTAGGCWKLNFLNAQLSDV